MNMRIRVVVRAIFVLAMVAASPAAFCTTVTFTAGGGAGCSGNECWNNPSNWSPSLVPGSGDDVIIPHVGTGTLRINVNATVNSIVIQSAEIVLIQSGSGLTVNNASSIAAGAVLELNSSNFQGAGHLDVFGTVEIFGGTLDGPGSLTIQSGGLLQFWGSVNSSRLLRDTVNSGTINFLNTITLGNHFGFGGATLANNGIIDIQTDHDVVVDAGSPALTNNSGGVIKKSAGAGSATINFRVNNAAGGTIQAQSGTLGINASSSVNGAYSISSGATLNFSGGTFTTSGNPTLAGSGTLSVSVSGTIEVNPGTFAMSGSPTVSCAGEIDIEGGTLDLGAGVNVTSNDAVLSSGSITGAGNLHVSGTFDWFGGTISGAGARVLNSGSTPTLSCSTSNCVLDGAALRLQAWGTYSASSNSLVFSNGANLILDPGQVLFVTNDGDFVSGSGGGSIAIGGFGSPGVNGCIEKTTTSGTSVIGVPVTMSGSFKVDAGTLQVAADVTASAGAIVHYSAGTTIEVIGGLFLLNSSSISFPAPGTFKVTAGTLRVPTGVTLTMPNVWLQNSGVIDGGGTLILSGTNFWTGGTMGSAAASGGITQVDPGSTLSILGSSAPQSLTQNRQLLNNGTMSYGGIGANTLTMSAGSRITNNNAFNLTNNSAINNSPAGSALIENFGTFARSSGSGGSTIRPRVENNNGATVSVITGTTVQLFGGGLNAGAYSISSGANLTLTPGNFTFAGTSTVTGTGTLQIEDATVDISSGTNAVWPNVFFSGGTIGGLGGLHVSGSFTWSGGTLAGAGPRVVDSTATSLIDNGFGTCTLDGAALQLQASTTYSAAVSPLVFSNGASLTIDPAKTLSITNDGDFTSGAGGGSIINNGTIWKKTTAGFSTIGVPVTLQGTSTVDIDTGTLQVGGGASVAAGATLDIAAGTTLEVTGGVTQFNSGSVSMPGSGNFKVSGGTLRVPTSINATVPNLTMTNGVIDGGGTLTLAGTSSWTFGTMGSAAAPGGITEINAGSTLNITTNGQSLIQGRELRNLGTINYGGTFSMTLIGASKITNNAAFHLISDAVINVSGIGGSSIDNNGTLDKSAGSGASLVIPALNNAGTVSVTAGTLSLAGGGTHSGSFNVTAPGNLSFSGGTHSITGGSINGTGTLTVNGATVTAGVPVNVGALLISGGTLTLNASGSVVGLFAMTAGGLGGSGTLTLNNGGTWSGGTMSGSGMTINPATKSFNIPTPVTLNARTLQNDGTLSVSGNVAGFGTIANNGTLNAVGNITIGATLNNSGQVATSGTLSLAGGGTNTGSFTVTTPGILSFSSGTQSMSGGGSISGTGMLRFSGAAATVGVPINVGNLMVSAGTATLNANASANAFTMTNGTLAGSGTLTLNGTSIWSGGTMSGSGTTINPATKSLSIAGPVTLNGRTLQIDGFLSLNGNVSGSGTVANNGLLSAFGNRTISLTVNNSGQVATQDALSLAGGGTHSGTFNAYGAGSVIDFSGGAHTISGTFTGPGKFRFSGAAATVNGAWSESAIDVTGGSVVLNTNGTIPTLTMSGGTLAGSGNVTVSGPSTWSGGSIVGSGALTFDTGAAVTMSGTSATTLNRPLLNNGTVTFTAASSAMLIAGVPVTNNGTFDIQSSQSIMVTAGTPPFMNNGTLKKSAGAGVMQFAAPLMNSGLVQAIAGTLNFSGTYAQSAGTTDVLPGATLQTATLSLNGGSLTGNGTIAGTVDNHAIVAPGASPGTLTINGDYVQESDGVLNIQIGGTAPGTQYDRLLVSGNVTLGGTLNVTTTNSFVPAPGNAFQILTFGARPNSTTFALIDGIDFGSGATLIPTYSATDLQLIDTNVQADLVVSVSAPPSIANGNAFAYAVNLLNQGGSDATAVSFNATLPPNVTFNSASPAICSGAPNLVCTVGALPNLSSAPVVLNVTANGAGTAPITVFAGGHEFDPNSANNSASASPSITASSDLRIAVTGPPSTVPGSRAIYTIVVTNSGPDLANNVAVSVATSPGLTFSANSGACAGSFPCTISALASGQSATINSAWDISPTAAGSVQLTVNAASPAADSNSSDNHASATTLIGTCPAIVIDAPGELRTGASAQATATPFGGAVYSWSISNGTIDSGNGSATIAFTTGTAGTATLAVNVSGGGCTITTAFPMTVKPRPTCEGTAAAIAPADRSTVADAAVNFNWTEVEGASGYRLWLQQAGVPAQNLGSTLDMSLTKIIPPGVHQWYVETLFDGCPSHESIHLTLTILPGHDCASHGAPQLSAPVNDTLVTSATVAFSWDAVANAIEYELWLAPAGGTPTLLRAAADTSYAATVTPGRFEWYVRALFGGCAATESVHRTFIYTPPPDCTSQRPLLIEPAEGDRLTSPVSFEWRAVPGATSYELYIDGVLTTSTTSPHASGIAVPLDERRWRVRARLAQGCGALDSAESRFAVIAASPSCTPLEAPDLTAPGQISSGVTGRVQWTFVAGATSYVVQVSADPRFPAASTTSSTVAERQLPFTFTNESSLPVARYVRVYAVDAKCVGAGTGPFSTVAVVSVLPRTRSEGVASLTDPTDVPYTLTIAAEFAGLNFSAEPTVPWMTVTPSSGIVPPGGQTLHAVAHTAGLPPGASSGNVVITTAAAGKLGTLGTAPPVKVPITINNTPGVTTKAKNTPPPDALTIPAVANVKNFIVRYQSDVCVTNTSAQVVKYQINFVPTGLPGITEGQTTNVSIEPGATLALNDIVTTWFGGISSTGTLEVRPLTETATSTSSAPSTGLAERTTFASSRTFAVTPAGGTYGQYVPAVPYTNFAGLGAILSMQQIAQSDKFHTNLGLVEGSGEPVSLQVRIFDGAGTKRAEFNVDLTGGQHTQINDVVKAHGVTLDDGRIEVEVTKGAGKVTAYASVIENATNDALLVPPVTINDAGHTKWVMPGVAGFTSALSNWQSDVRIFNAGKDAVDLTLTFHSRNGGTATTRTITLAAGEVRQFDRVLSSFFGISQDAGALHVSTEAPARLVMTARTYNETGQGAYGQFIAAVTPEESVSAGSRSLQILQVEDSAQYRSNVGFAEVSGNAVTLEVSVFRPNHNEPTLLEVNLGPNEFRQIDSLLSTLGLADIYNARISVRAVSGEGRATAYLSLIDMKTGDPTYIPGQ